MLHINSLRKYNEAEPDDQPAEVVNVVLNDDFDPRAEALGGGGRHDGAARHRAIKVR